MKHELSNKLGFLGAGIGIALFAVFGLHPGAFLGGLMGLNVANLIAGPAVMPTLLARTLVAGGMLLGVLGTGLIFTLGGAVTGWVAGRVGEAVARTAHREQRAVQAHR